MTANGDFRWPPTGRFSWPPSHPAAIRAWLECPAAPAAPAPRASPRVDRSPKEQLYETVAYPVTGTSPQRVARADARQLMPRHCPHVSRAGAATEMRAARPSLRAPVFCSAWLPERRLQGAPTAATRTLGGGQARPLPRTKSAHEPGIVGQTPRAARPGSPRGPRPRSRRSARNSTPSRSMRVHPRHVPRRGPAMRSESGRSTPVVGCEVRRPHPHRPTAGRTPRRSLARTGPLSEQEPRLPLRAQRSQQWGVCARRSVMPSACACGSDGVAAQQPGCSTG